MTKDEALYKVKGYLTDIIPIENYSEVEEIIKALEQEPCEDCISRQDAIDAIRASALKYTGFMAMEMYTDDDAVEAIEDLRSAKPKTGHWIDEETNYLCSECHRGCWVNSDYCPWCGAYMKGEEE